MSMLLVTVYKAELLSRQQKKQDQHKFKISSNKFHKRQKPKCSPNSKTEQGFN